MKDNDCLNDALSDFHIVMDTGRLAKLDYFMKLFAIKRRSAFIRFLLESFSMFLEQAHFLNEELMGQYRLINSNKDVKRKSIHMFIPVKIHRGIKLIHQDLDYYSMAQIVRGVVDVFIILAQELGDGFCEYIDKKQKEWDKIILKYRNSKKPIRKRQLSEMNRTWRGERERIELKTMYDNHFLPIEIQLE